MRPPSERRYSRAVTERSCARRVGIRDVGRTLLTVAAIAPGLVTGLATLAWTRDRRRALNRAIELWGRLGTRAAGIDLRVRGAEHLEIRPAVFIINHQSGVDPFLVCALLRRDFVGVAKREIRRNPVLGPAFAFAGTVFLDRADSEQAIRSLEPAVDTLRRGIAIAMAPEGTRSPGAAIGRLKKGAFRLAMAARVPLVPIVILDSTAVLPIGGWIMTAAPVHVVVHPPIPTDTWRLEALEQHVERLERLYEESLAQPPRVDRATRVGDRLDLERGAAPGPVLAPLDGAEG